MHWKCLWKSVEESGISALGSSQSLPPILPRFYSIPTYIPLHLMLPVLTPILPTLFTQTSKVFKVWNVHSSANCKKTNSIVQFFGICGSLCIFLNICINCCLYFLSKLKQKTVGPGSRFFKVRVRIRIGEKSRVRVRNTAIHLQFLAKYFPLLFVQ